MGSSTKKQKKPNVFEFHSYREFLKEWLAHGRANRSLTLRDLSKKTGLSLGYMNMILSGKRNLTTKAFKRLNRVLKLTPSESSFFKNLVTISDSEAHAERLNSLQYLRNFSQFKTIQKQDFEGFQYLTNWLHVAIREMSNLPDFKFDPDWIKARLKEYVPRSSVEESLKFLIANGFIEKRESTKVVKNQSKTLNCTDGIYKISLSEFHSQLFNLASKSISETPREQRSIMGLTRTLSQSQLDSLKQKIENFIQEMAHAENTNGNQEVYHIGMFAFPLTETKKSGG